MQPYSGNFPCRLVKGWFITTVPRFQSNSKLFQAINRLLSGKQYTTIKPTVNYFMPSATLAQAGQRLLQT
jgi:hypothetical protein